MSINAICYHYYILTLQALSPGYPSCLLYKFVKSTNFQAKTEKKCEELRKNPEEFNSFVGKVEQWLGRYNRTARAIAMFQQFDSGDETISYDEFKAGMLNHYFHQYPL